MAAAHAAPTYFIQYPRSKEPYVSYECLETLKDGLWTTAKYEGEVVVRNSPHVVVFANFPPNTAALSMDRWKIGEIVDDRLHWR